MQSVQTKHPFGTSALSVSVASTYQELSRCAVASGCKQHAEHAVKGHCRNAAAQSNSSPSPPADLQPSAGAGNTVVEGG